MTQEGIQAEVDRLIDARPGLALMEFPYDEVAYPIVDGFVYRSGGTTASYLVVTDAGRLIVNTGMGFEAPHHKSLFDAVFDGPTPYIVTTQGHVDHVGGVAHFREPGTRYVAQANNPRCQADDARIQGARAHSVDVWFGHLGGGAAWLMERHPGALLEQDRPTPDVTFDRRLALRIGDLDVECISTPGGETVDACVVWLPQHRICFVSNLVGPMFPHFPNFNTLRGDKYRFVEPYLESVRTVRALQPEILVTGRNEPIRGAALIDACLGRLHDAVDYVHRATLDGINAGTDIFTLMREIRLPDHLRVGQEYGRVSWAVRTIWESYLGWFRLHSSTELYPVHARDAFATVVDLAGADALVARAREQLDGGEPVVALHLVEAVLAAAPDHTGARDTAIAAHERLLADGEDRNFWAAGWLRYQVERLRQEATD
jgi:alkyl sulfatase BDS1-like metallo-beta-lactamase superfamily hydrolase